MPRTSDPTVLVSYLTGISLLQPSRNATPTRFQHRHLPTYLPIPPYSTYLFYIPTTLPYSPYPTSPIHPSTNPIQPSHPFPSHSPPLHQSKTMLPRPATKLHLTIDDITDYERRKAQRDALQQAQQTQKQQQTQEKSNANFLEEKEEESTRARAKAKLTRERIMGSRA